jgi:hypothetical protein
VTWRSKEYSAEPDALEVGVAVRQREQPVLRRSICSAGSTSDKLHRVARRRRPRRRICHRDVVTRLGSVLAQGLSRSHVKSWRMCGCAATMAARLSRIECRSCAA